MVTREPTEDTGGVPVALPKFGEHKLATETIELPPERDAIAEIQAERTYTGWDAVAEAANLGLIRPNVRHAELSPTFRCTEDCGGCMDRISLHINEPPEQQLDIEGWLDVRKRLKAFGVEYFLLIGGTIDRHEATAPLMAAIAADPDADGGWFTDGIILHDKKTGTTNRRYQELMEEGRMGEITTHLSADYLVPEGVQPEGPILDSTLRWDNLHPDGSRWYKSAFGLRTARDLVKDGAKRVVLNTAISARNIDQVLDVYRYACALQEEAAKIGSPTVVLFTVSPWIWRPHLARGDNPKNYNPEVVLRDEHRSELSIIANTLVADTQLRIANGQPRVAANSIGYLFGLPEHAVTQDVPYLNGSGELAVTPNGTVRMDPIFVSARMLEFARSPYGYRDRDLDGRPFASFAAGISGPHFENLIQTTKNPAVAWR